MTDDNWLKDRFDRLKASSLREAKRVHELLARSRPSGDKHARKVITKPTPEQRRRADYVLEDVVDRQKKGVQITIGHAYKKRPWFETMHERGLIDETDLKCLRYYRRAFENAQRSELKSCLDRDPGKGTGDGPGPQVLEAKEVLELCEEAIGSVLTTMRAIALGDMPFKQVAMARFGSRELTEYRGLDKRTTFHPLSKAHPKVIEQEFDLGLHLLRQSVELRARLVE